MLVAEGCTLFFSISDLVGTIIEVFSYRIEGLQQYMKISSDPYVKNNLSELIQASIKYQLEVPHSSNKSAPKKTKKKMK